MARRFVVEFSGGMWPLTANFMYLRVIIVYCALSYQNTDIYARWKYMLLRVACVTS